MAFKTTITKLLLLLLIVLVVALPYLGLLFGVFMVTAGLAFLLGVVFGIAGLAAGAWSAFSAGLWVYVPLVLPTFVVLLTFSYQNVSIGLRSFSEHLANVWPGDVLMDALGALLWPYAWFMLDRNMRGWGLTFGDIVFNAGHYWLIGRRQGTKVEMFDLQSGVQTTLYAKTPDETFEAMRGFVAGGEENRNAADDQES